MIAGHVRRERIAADLLPNVLYAEQAAARSWMTAAEADKAMVAQTRVLDGAIAAEVAK
jgi:hypothetical protein